MHMKQRQLNPQAARQFIAGLLFLFMALPLAQGQNKVDVWDGTSIAKQLSTTNKGITPEEPILITTAAELAYLAQQTNASLDLELSDGNTIPYGNDIRSSGFEGIHFALGTDIDLAGHNWTPIGISGHLFNGNFDGKGHCVSGLTAITNGTTNVNIGLFGLSLFGTIQNLGVKVHKKGIKANGEECSAGGIAGNADIIRNCYVEGPGLIEAAGTRTSCAGGIAGSANEISHCYATVDVKASGGIDGCCAGGILGYNANGNAKYFCTYATGSVQATYAGGISGQYSGTLSYNLALNKEIKGGTNNVHRIVGGYDGYVNPYISNYASPEIYMNGQPATNTTDAKGKDGSETGIDLTNYATTLKTADAPNAPADAPANEWNSGAWVFDTNGLLPQLQMRTGEDDGGKPIYEAWPSSIPQPKLRAIDYMPGFFALHIVATNGGSVTVKDGANNDIPNGTPVLSGTTLTLSHSANDNYEFVGLLSGTDPNSLADRGNSLTMPKSELWVSAKFKEKPEPEPEVPVYHTVTLPAVEGATTSPGPGDHQVESWDNFRFYLTLDPACSESQPIVTTSRGETIQPRISDGAYLVKYVRTDVQIFIDGIQPNTPTANAAIDAAIDIKAQGNILLISVPQAIQASLCDLSGRLLQRLDLAPGQTRIEGLRAGIYIVKVPGYAGVKVIIK